MAKKVTWENVKNDLAKLWPNYVSAGELAKLDYGEEDKLVLLLSLLIDAEEVEPKKGARGRDTAASYRINYGSAEENLSLTLDMLEDIIPCVSKKMSKEPAVTTVMELLLRFNRTNKGQFDKTFEKVVRGKREPLGAGFGSKVNECLNSAVLVKKDNKTVNRQTVHENMQKRGLDIVEERVAKLISACVTKKWLVRAGGSSPAHYKVSPAGMAEWKKYTRKRQQLQKAAA